MFLQVEHSVISEECVVGHIQTFLKGWSLHQGQLFIIYPVGHCNMSLLHIYFLELVWFFGHLVMNYLIVYDG